MKFHIQTDDTATQNGALLFYKEVDSRRCPKPPVTQASINSLRPYPTTHDAIRNRRSKRIHQPATNSKATASIHPSKAGIEADKPTTAPSSPLPLPTDIPIPPHTPQHTPNYPLPSTTRNKVVPARTGMRNLASALATGRENNAVRTRRTYDYIVSSSSSHPVPALPTPFSPQRRT